jgi:tetratricopeptide (TPR) repeat protein
LSDHETIEAVAVFPKAAEKSMRRSNFPLVRCHEKGFNRYRMTLRGIAAVAALALISLAVKSFAAETVAPTKAELEEMYNAAYRAFDAKKFSEALKELDAIDARQPDLAASKNLRGVIQMRQGKYDEAESALQEAARIDPKFWNARFNLAEIPFLKKDWAEARKRFEQLLASGGSDLAKEASQLIQYKILLTYLQKGKGDMVDSMLAKLELSPDTPAVDYVKAAVALQAKNQSEAKDWISAAEKNYSPQLNKLFAESLYEAGWLEKPSGEGRPSLPLMTAAERTEKIKAAARSKFEQSQQALRQGDLAAALKLADEADKADPNKPITLNLRGEILMQQQQFDQAEAAFKKAARLDPKLREAQYNLAQVPFKKKDYAKAQERFEALYSRIPGGDKNQAAELIKFKIYMTLLLQGKESRAHATMEEFQFTGDTPALYYAQAAWEYKHNNPEKAADWTSSANKIYSSALNSVFADAFYDVGWMQRPEGSAAPALAFDTTSVVAPQTDSGPAVEPSAIPDKVAGANKQAEASSGETLSLVPTGNEPNTVAEVASAEATAGPVTAASNESTAGTGPQPQQPASESPAAGGEPVSVAKAGGESPVAAQPVAAETPQAASASTEQNNQQASVQTSPAKQAPMAAATSNVSTHVVAGIASRRLAIVAGLLLAAIIILAWVIVPVVRRHAFNVPRHMRLEPPGGAAAASTPMFKPTVVPAQTSSVKSNGFIGGPRQVSVQLKPWQGPLRHAAAPTRKLSGAFDRLKERKAKPVQSTATREPERELTPIAEPDFESSVGEVVEQAPEIRAVPQVPEIATAAATTEFAEASAIIPQQPDDVFGDGDGATFYAQEPGGFFGEVKEAVLPVQEEPSQEAFADPQFAWPPVETSDQLTAEPIAQEQHGPSSSSEFPMVEATTESMYDFPSVTEPVFSQITTPATMPETTQTPTAPPNKAPAPPVARPQSPPAGMQTSVQLTFSFEIAAMQLTPSFKMGVLKVRPISKLVTMRLPSPQRAQSALNLQVAFEIVKIQPVAGAIGTIRVVPSQQQRPSLTGMPSIAVAGLQVVPNSETAPVQLTPSPQGRASVFITIPFQISSLEFSPSLEIASVILNSNSKQVIVQLPGAGPSPAEGAPMFEIANLELNENGEIGMVQLNLLGGPKRT